VEGSAGNFTVKVKSFKPDERRFPVYGASYPVRLEEYEESEIEVRAIMLAGGFENFDPHKKAEYGYGRHKNCLTALELERMIHESGHIKIPSSGKKPHSIAFIQCIGSRDVRRGREYCSSICCTFALKEALAIKEILEDVAVSLFFYDMRPYGKDTEKFYQEAQEKGVKFIRSGVWRIEELEDLTLEVCYVDESGKHLFSQFDIRHRPLICYR
jgi:heterodisulfide reductase subunit A-like polyferredoxin